MSVILPLKIPESMKKFLDMLSNYPYAEQYWCVRYGSYEVDIEGITGNMGVYSHGQQLIIKFLVAVFTGNNLLEFDLLEAVPVLDKADIDMICNWMQKPFWP